METASRQGSCLLYDLPQTCASLICWCCRDALRHANAAYWLARTASADLTGRLHGYSGAHEGRRVALTDAGKRTRVSTPKGMPFRMRRVVQGLLNHFSVGQTWGTNIAANPRGATNICHYIGLTKTETPNSKPLPKLPLEPLSRFPIYRPGKHKSHLQNRSFKQS